MNKGQKQSKLDGVQGVAPELRFQEFENSTNWDIKKFEKVFERITKKNSINNQNVLTISAQHGLVSQLEYFNKKVSSKNVTGYYLLHKGEFAYNKSYSNGYPMGAIKQLKFYDKGVVSTLYICFKTKKGYNSSFFDQYFDSGIINSEIKNIAQEGGRAHGLLNVSVKRFFKDINLSVPLLKEQQKIANCLSSLDNVINAETEKLDLLQDHKKGLLQQLFPQQGESQPKYRFPEFKDDGVWLLDKFSKFIKLYRGSSPRPISEYVTDDKNGVNWIKIGDTKNADGFNVSKVGEKITIEGSKKSRKVAKGELILANSMSYGAVYELKIDGCIYDGWFVLREFEDNFNKKFLLQLLNSDFIQNQYKKLAAGGIVQNISSVIVNNTLLPKPSIEEQQKIANCLSSVDELIASQQQKIESLKAHKKGLLQKLFPSLNSI